jgi:hypothetical protein
VKGCFAVAAAAAAALAAALLSSDLDRTALLAALAPFVAAGAVSAVLSSRYKKAFKAAVVPALLDGIAPGLEYRPEGYLDESEFTGCRMFRRPDRYSGNDLVRGRVGRTDVRFSLVHAEERQETSRTDSDGRTQSETTWSTIFRGLLFSADFNKEFRGETRVLSGSPGILSGLLPGLVTLESPEFESFFTVRSTDPVEARYILTPSLMERIVALRRKFDAKGTCLSFVASRVHVAVPMGTDAFEPSLRRPADDPATTAAIAETLDSILDIVADLDLDTRIWTKR